MNHLMLLAQEGNPSGLLDRLIRPEIMVFCVPIVAIVCVIGYKITTAVIAHRERMAKIQHGIDPDSPDGRA